MGGEDRSLVLWALSSLMVAEERITTKFSGLVGAYGTEEEATFLATQQVDEARHMQFYARFQDEVVADPAAIAEHVARAREQLSPGLRRDLRRGAGAGPRAAGGRARRRRRRRWTFVTTYHLVIEGTLGLTAFNFIIRYLERERAAARLRGGLLEDPPRRAAPHRLRHLVPARGRRATTPELAENVRDTLRALLPAVAEALTPPDRDGTDWDALGASSEEIREFALSGLTRRLKIVGCRSTL